jgi:hypothetical protein
MNEARPTRDISLDIFLQSHDFGSRRPQNEMEALMQAPPGYEPVESMEEVQPLREVVAQCIDMLTEQDQYVVNAINSERVTLQELGNRLGISRMHASRLRDAAFARLKEIMIMHPVIRRRVQMVDTWEQSAMQWVSHLSSLSHTPNKLNIDVLEKLIDNAWKQRDHWDDSPSVTLWTGIGCAAIREMIMREGWDSGFMVSTLVKKQLDYGHGNINKFGTTGILVRLSDKVQRFKNLTTTKRNPQVESIHDTLMDIVGYCVIGLMYDDGTFQLQVGDEYAS